MRFLTLLLTLILTITSANTMAVETGFNPQAMFYLNIPFDGNEASNDQSTYGFRLDSHAYTRYDNVPYVRQLDQTAVFDFKMEADRIEGIYISGVDYLKLYQVNKQNEDEDEYEDQITIFDEIRGWTSYMSSIAPMGVWIGVGLGVGLLVGN
ncbi:MAG: hypothetical protein ACI9XC_000850 [Gammaproteobacteria bacterium]|jgi:hypothetical protein